MVIATSCEISPQILFSNFSLTNAYLLSHTQLKKNFRKRVWSVKSTKSFLLFYEVAYVTAILS